MRIVACSAVLAAVFLFACSNKIEGSIKIDGQAFPVDSCQSGQRNGFVGVDLIAADGKRLRLVVTPTGAPRAILFAGESVGVEVGDCGAVTVERQNSTINDVTNVRGSAQLSCKSDGHTVEGQISFENCH